MPKKHSHHRRTRHHRRRSHKKYHTRKHHRGGRGGEFGGNLGRAPLTTSATQQLSQW